MEKRPTQQVEQESAAQERGPETSADMRAVAAMSTALRDVEPAKLVSIFEDAEAGTTPELSPELQSALQKRGFEMAA